MTWHEGSKECGTEANSKWDFQYIQTASLCYLDCLSSGVRIIPYSFSFAHVMYMYGAEVLDARYSYMDLDVHHASRCGRVYIQSSSPIIVCSQLL